MTADQNCEMYPYHHSRSFYIYPYQSITFYISIYINLYLNPYLSITISIQLSPTSPGDPGTPHHGDEGGAGLDASGPGAAALLGREKPWGIGVPWRVAR